MKLKILTCAIIITAGIALAGCTSGTQTVELEITQAVTEASTPEPTTTPEPTLPPEIAKHPLSMQTLTDELPENYEFIKDESRLIIHHQFGDIIYENITIAGTNSKGYTIFYNDKTNEEVWVVDDLSIGIISHDDMCPKMPKDLKEMPKFSNEFIENAWHSKNGDISAIFIALDEINVNWNDINTKEYPEGFIEYIMECKAEYSNDSVDKLKAEVEYISRIFNGVNNNSQFYPSSIGTGTELSNYYYEVEGDLNGKYNSFVYKALKIYPNYREFSESKTSGSAEYLLINTNLLDKYEVYNQNRMMRINMTSYMHNPTPENYYNLQKSVWDTENYSAALIIFAQSTINYGMQKDDFDKSIKYNGINTTGGELYGDLIYYLEKTSDNYNSNPKPAFTTPAGEYFEDFNILIPDEASAE